MNLFVELICANKFNLFVESICENKQLSGLINHILLLTGKSL